MIRIIDERRDSVAKEQNHYCYCQQNRMPFIKVVRKRRFASVLMDLFCMEIVDIQMQRELFNLADSISPREWKYRRLPVLLTDFLKERLEEVVHKLNQIGLDAMKRNISTID